MFLRTKQALENELRELLETGLALADNRVSSDYEFWVDLMIKYESVVDSAVNNLSSSIKHTYKQRKCSRTTKRLAKRRSTRPPRFQKQAARMRRS